MTTKHFTKLKTAYMPGEMVPMPHPIALETVVKVSKLRTGQGNIEITSLPSNVGKP